MSPLFGKKKKGAGKTVALLDIENGSVGAALARLSPQDAPRLFAETRIALPFSYTHNTHLLAREVEKALNAALLRVGEVAARVRAHNILGAQGEIEHAAIFFSPPWASMHLRGGTADYVPHMQEAALFAVQGLLGDRPVTFHPFGTAAAHGVTAVFTEETPTVLCVASHELSEILLIDGGRLAGRATIPLGSHTFLRTLVSHGGVSPQEAASLLRLATQNKTHPMMEPLSAAGTHYAELFTDAARDLLIHTPATRILVMAPEPAVESLARALAAHAPLTEVFPQDTTVQAVRAHHVQPLIAAHGARPDLPLMLEALFADAKFGIY